MKTQKLSEMDKKILDIIDSIAVATDDKVTAELIEKLGIACVCSVVQDTWAVHVGRSICYAAEHGFRTPQEALREVPRRGTDAYHTANALFLAGRVADAAINLVGGNGLSFRMPPAQISNISVLSDTLRKRVEEYNAWISNRVLLGGDDDKSVIEGEDE